MIIPPLRKRNLLKTGGIHVSLSEDARLKKAGNMALPVHTFRCRKGLMSAGRRAFLVSFSEEPARNYLLEYYKARERPGWRPRAIIRTTPDPP